MRKITVLIATCLFAHIAIAAGPPPKPEHILLKMKGNGDGCVESTEIQNRKGANSPVCKWKTKIQSDGFCTKSGEKVNWKGNKVFSITEYGTVFSSCAGQDSKSVECTVAGGIANGPYSYAIETDYKDGSKCVLDPRIIVNNGH